MSRSDCEPGTAALTACRYSQYPRFRNSWKAAGRRARVVARIFHDLRRTAARDMRRAGTWEGEIMRLCGGRTRSLVDCCNIIDEADLIAAVAKRFEKANATPRPQGSVA